MSFGKSPPFFCGLLGTAYLPTYTTASQPTYRTWFVWSTDITHRSLEKKTIDIPVLFIQATDDAALPPSLSEGMERFVPHLTRREVQAGHWALWQKPGEINAMIGEWLEKVVEEKTKKSSL